MRLGGVPCPRSRCLAFRPHSKGLDDSLDAKLWVSRVNVPIHVSVPTPYVHVTRKHSSPSRDRRNQRRLNEYEWSKLVRLAEDERDRLEMWVRAFHDLVRRETVCIGDFVWLAIYHAEVLRQGVRYVHPQLVRQLG